MKHASCLTVLFVLFTCGIHKMQSQRKEDLVVDAFQLLQSLGEVLSFLEYHHEEINIDGLLGITLAQAQLHQIPKENLPYVLVDSIEELLYLCQDLNTKIRQTISMDAARDKLFADVLLNYKFWMKKISYEIGVLEDLGIYSNWTEEDILADKHAEYKGVPTDHCLLEVIEESLRHTSECEVSHLCEEMMFEDRIDTGYLLTHRLLYLQISQQTECICEDNRIRQLTKFYCSLILKEAKTNEDLNFPQHDIFLEQVVLCGMEGYAEFTSANWRQNVIDWKSPQGCYKSDSSKHERSTNIISFGCTDHTTGLGAAALATNLRYLLS